MNLNQSRTETQTLNPLSATIKIIDSVQALRKLAEKLKNDTGPVALDIETTGLSAKEGDRTIGWSVTFSDLDSYYVITRSFESGELNDRPCLEHTPVLLKQLTKKDLVLHNAVFDVGFLLDEFNIDLTDAILADTILMAHTLDAGQKLGLKELGEKYWPGSNQSQQDLEEAVKAVGGKWLKSNKQMFMAPAEIIAKYGAMDTALTMALFQRLSKELESASLLELFYKEEIMPLYKLVTIPMNQKGLRVDLHQLENVKHDIISNIHNLDTKLENQFAGMVPPFAKELNLNSNEHLAWLLFYYYHETPTKLTGKGEAAAKELIGKRPITKSDMKLFKEQCDARDMPFRKYCCTDAQVLKSFSLKYEWIQWLLDLKKEKKLLTTYVEALESKNIDGYIYPSFLQFGTVTGRYSSRNPNFQNLPSRDTRIKSCIAARDGYSFVGADYSQLEPRILSHLTKDPLFIDAFKSGDDFYSVVAMNTFKLDPSRYSANPNSSKFLKKTNNKYRDTAKVFSLSAAYNTTPNKMQKTIKQQAGIEYPRKKVYEMIDNYFGMFPSIVKYMDGMKMLAQRHGRTQNMFGRRRNLPGCKEMAIAGDNEKNFEFKKLMNIACNYPIQSSAAGVINRAAISAARTFLNNPEWHATIVMNIHDEIIVECKDEYTEEVSLALKDAMENTVNLRVPLNADPVVGKNLAEAK